MERLPQLGVPRFAMTGGEIAGGAREKLEERLGRSIVTKNNFLPQKKKKGIM
ncbi:hypothetical protein GW844_03505 [bacterium]|nr:hypothetical protein [bacterium]